MSDKTGIEWTDATWNPVTGCTKVSAGCDNCYAETLAERFRGTKAHYFEHGFDLQLRPDKLDQPIRWTRPRRIFVNSMSDLFHDQVPDEYIAKVFAVMALAPQHTFQILTKRHARMRSLLNAGDFQTAVAEQMLAMTDEERLPDVGDPFPLPNVWLGVSAENQRWADIRIPVLLDTPAAVRFVSAEPLLGPIDLHTDPIHADAPFWGSQLEWVIVGGESGRGARPMHPDWARALRDQCTDAGVAFHFKQWGEWTPGRIVPHRAMSGGAFFAGEKVGGHFAVSLSSVHDFGDGNGAYHIGKKDAGRDLDGRTWDEYPGARS